MPSGFPGMPACEAHPACLCGMGAREAPVHAGSGAVMPNRAVTVLSDRPAASNMTESRYHCVF